MKSASDKFAVLVERDFSDPSSFHDVAASVHHLCSRIADAERAGVEHAQIRDLVAEARTIHARSPFVRRLQTWPRGYPGDFETMEYLLDQRVQAAPGSFEYWLEYLSLSSPVAQQHRNKVQVQSSEIATAILSGKPHPRVLLLAAGSSPDLLTALPMVSTRDFSVILNDGDAEALVFSVSRLGKIRDRVQTVSGNVLRSVSRLAAHGPFDLVMAGGLFDYLPDRHATFLLRSVWEQLLQPGGRFFFTNIGQGNPYRVLIEYMGDWQLIERSSADLRELVATACGPEAVCTIQPDGTGLAWLVSVDRRSSR